MIRKIDTNWKACNAFIWRGEYLHPIRDFNEFKLDDLVGIDEQKDALLKNTQSFMDGNGGMNALLYGPRGCGKSTLVRSIFTKFMNEHLKVIQVAPHDVSIIPIFIDAIREQPYKFIIFCDDLSFEFEDTSYKALKVVLDGSIEKFPNNILLYATSNRKHLIQEPQSDNENTRNINGEIHFQDVVEERISLSDRFGLSIPFYKTTLNEYLKIVAVYFGDYVDSETQKKAIAYATQRGSRSGRVAFDFYRATKIGLL